MPISCRALSSRPSRRQGPALATGSPVGRGPAGHSLRASAAHVSGKGEGTLASMAERGARTTGQHRGHPVALDGDPWVPDRINASMDAVEPAGLNPPGDTARRECGPEELLVRDDAVLPCGDPGDDLVRVDAFLPHTGNNASGPLRAPLPRRMA